MQPGSVSPDIRAISEPKSAAERRLRWAFLNPVRHGWGGMEGWMIRLAEGLRERGDACVMIGRTESRWPVECRARGLLFEALFFGGELAPATWWKLRRILARHGADVVIAKGFKQARWARLVWPRAIVSVKIPSARELAGGAFDRWTAHRAIDRILTDNATARAAARNYRGWPQDKIFAVHNGVADPGVWPDPQRRARARRRVAELVGNDVFVVAWVGRMETVKAPETAVHALASGGGDGALVMFGDGPLLPNVMALARSLGIERRVVFAGWREDVREWLWGCDLLVNSSETEGLPNAVLEAMAAGLPVAATDAGGTREAVEDGVTGFVTPVGDAAALGRRIAQLREHPALREGMGAAGAERVRREFTVATMTEGIRAVMIAALEKKRGKREA